jgi:hypothetical protein
MRRRLLLSAEMEAKIAAAQKSAQMEAEHKMAEFMKQTEAAQKTQAEALAKMQAQAAAAEEVRTVTVVYCIVHICTKATCYCMCAAGGYLCSRRLQQRRKAFSRTETAFLLADGRCSPA